MTGARRCAVLALLLGLAAPLHAQVLDDFEAPSGWTAAPSDGVTLVTALDSGRTGKALRLDFDFQGHGGYAVARKNLPLTLPENYAFTFWIRGTAPVNNLEFKLIDSTGDNVWWRNQRNFTFPREWRKVTIRKRQIEFAWGPKGGGQAGGIAAIELAITAGTGGREASGSMISGWNPALPIDPTTWYPRPRPPVPPVASVPTWWWMATPPPAGEAVPRVSSGSFWIFGGAANSAA